MLCWGHHLKEKKKRRKKIEILVYHHPQAINGIKQWLPMING
jgi:hypothetical protein